MISGLLNIFTKKYDVSMYPWKMEKELKHTLGVHRYEDHGPSPWLDLEQEFSPLNLKQENNSHLG